MTEEQLIQAGVLVDDEDRHWLSLYNWSITKEKRVMTSVTTRNGRKTVLLSRAILAPLPTQFVDHKDGNGLNNKRENLRLCTNQENSRNQRVGKRNTSGYKGVSLAINGNWRAEIRVDGKGKHLGCYKNIHDAARAYNKAAIKYFGEFANLNTIEDETKN